mgnify:CR=1 FL=1
MAPPPGPAPLDVGVASALFDIQRTPPTSRTAQQTMVLLHAVGTHKDTAHWQAAIVSYLRRYSTIKVPSIDYAKAGGGKGKHTQKSYGDVLLPELRRCGTQFLKVSEVSKSKPECTALCLCPTAGSCPLTVADVRGLQSTWPRRSRQIRRCGPPPSHQSHQRSDSSPKLRLPHSLPPSCHPLRRPPRRARTRRSCATSRVDFAGCQLSTRKAGARENLEPIVEIPRKRQTLN